MKSELIKCLFILVLGMLLGATVIARLFPNSRLHNTVCDAVVCDTTTVYDTIRVYKPVPRDSVVVRYVTQVVEVTREEEQPTIAEESEQEPSITVEATSSDSVRVNVPITQKVYETEDYRAYVSGYQPSLDSLLFLRPYAGRPHQGEAQAVGRRRTGRLRLHSAGSAALYRRGNII